MKRITLLTIFAVMLSIASYAQGNLLSFTEGRFSFLVTKQPTNTQRGEVALTSMISSVNYLTLKIPGEITHNDVTYNVTTIKSNALSGITASTVVIGYGVTTLNENALSGITDLTTVKFPSSIDFTASNVFSALSTIENIYCAAITAPELGSNFFPAKFNLDGTPALNLYVPRCDRESYEKSDSWNGNFSIKSSEDAYDFTDADGGRYSVMSDVPREITDYFDIPNKCLVLTSYVRPSNATDGFTYSPLSGASTMTVLGKSLTLSFIGNMAFYDTDLHHADFNHATGIRIMGNNAFAESVLESIILNDGIQMIGDYAFNNASSLESITLPEGLKRLGAWAFQGTSIKTLALPASLINIRSVDGDYGFRTDALETITVAEGNTKYAAVFNMLFNKDITELIACPIKWQAPAWASKYVAMIPLSVKKIAPYAFYNNANITEVRLPYGVTTVEECAFRQANKLEKVYIPSSVTSLGEESFGYCNSLAQVAIAASTPPTLEAYNYTNYKGDPFYASNHNAVLLLPRTNPNAVADYTNANYSSSFSSMEISGDANDCYSPTTGIKYIVTKAPTSSENGELTLVGYVPTYYTSYKLNSWDSMNIKNYIEGTYSVTGIADEACKDVTTMVGATLPSTIKSIGANAFNGCTGLTEVSINEGLTKMGRGAFANCTKLTTLALPSTLTEIATDEDSKYDFINGCTSLSTIEVAEGNTVYASGRYGLYTADMQTLLRAPMNISCYGGYGYGFYCNSELGIKHVWNGAWEGISKLTYAGLQHGVETIGKDAFKGCNLQRIHLPSSLTSIGDNAFADNNAIKYVGIAASTPPTMGNNVFPAVENMALYVPRTSDTSIADYSAASGFNVFSTITESPLARDFNLSTAGTSYIVTKPATGDEKSEVTLVGCEPIYYSSNHFFVEISDYSDYKWYRDNYVVTAISRDAAKGITNGVGNVYIPSTVKSIGASAFEGSSLSGAVVIPESVVSIGEKAFYDCANLNELFFESKTGLKYYADMFTSCNIYGNNASDFTCYVDYKRHRGCEMRINSSTYWDITAEEKADRLSHLSSYIYSDYSADVLRLNHPTEIIPAAGEPFAFAVTGFDTRYNYSELKNITYIGKNEPFVITNLEEGKNYRLPRKEEKEVNDGNLLVYANTTVPADGKTYVYNAEKRGFDLMTEDGSVGNYLMMDKTSYPSFLPLDASVPVYGDVNGDRNVDVDDVNAIIDLILNLTDLYREYADINDDGSVDIDDLNIIIDLMLN